MNAQDGYITLFFTLGTFVLISYRLYWPAYNMWAGLNNITVFSIWCISALLSIVGFLSFSIHMMLSNQQTEIYELTLIPYSLFLFSSALYMPLASKKKITPTIVTLLVAAASSIALAYCSFQIFAWKYTTVFVIFLAIHCTLFDLFFWSWTWAQELAYNIKEQEIELVFLTDAI